MASGIPVVSTRVSGIPELIKSGQNGLLVPAHDPQHLADAIESLLTDPPLRDRLARAARGTIQANFSLDRSVSDLLSVFPVSVAR